MGISNQEIQRVTAFYHALGKVLTEENNSIAGEKYKSAHNVQSTEVWVDPISYSATLGDAESETALNDALTMVGTSASPVRMYPLQGSNYQAWFLDTGTPSVSITGCVPSDGWVKPFINPSDVTNAAGAPSNGFLFNMYRPNLTAVNYLTSFWDVDYYSGIIKFEPSRTPGDAGNNLGFVTSALDGTNTASIGALEAFLDSEGPQALAFQYTGDYLDQRLNNLPTSSGGSVGGNGSEEWQSSVNGYLINVGNGLTVSSFTAIGDQLNYLNTEYNKYFILTGDDISGVTWSGITTTGSYYEFNGSTFSAYGLTTSDDSNRFLLTETTLDLDVIVISATGAVTEFPDTTILADRIIEYTGTATSGWSYSAWQVTDPRIGMITTLDNLESSLVRYVGVGTGWVEYQYESTYKVNSQKDIGAITTTNDNDIAITETIQFEPSGDKSIDILVNGVEVPSSVYTFGVAGATTAVTVNSNGTNTIIVPNADAPTTGQYLILTTVANDFFRQVTGVTASGGTQSLITYGGLDVTSVLSASKFTITPRSNNVARQGDYLLWLGSSWYQLDQSVPSDLITLEYVTMDASSLNI